MREVVWQDLLMNRTTLILNTAIFAATWVVFTYLGIDSARAVAVFAGLMAAFLPVTIITREDRANAMALVCSLPVTRRTIVRGRYALGVLLVLGALALILTIVAAMPTALPAGAIFEPTPLLIALGVSFLIMALMMPVTLRLGFNGLMVLMVALQALGVVLLVLTQLTGAVVDERIIAAIVTGVARAATVLGTPGFHIALLALLVAALGLSYRVSVALFERREL